MKTIQKVKTIVVLCFLTILSFGQTTLCRPSNNDIPSGARPQASSCNQLIKDLAPSANDRALEINVYFWIAAPTTNSSSSVWTNANHYSPNYLQQCVDNTTSTFTNIPATPQLPFTGAANSYFDSKVRFKLKGYTIIYSDFYYKNVWAFEDTVNNTAYYDPNAINVYLGTQTVVNTYTSATSPYTYTVIEDGERIQAPGDIPAPYKNCRITMTQAFFKTTTSPVYDFIETYGPILAHEYSHVLGLGHTTGPFTYTVPDPINNPGETSFAKPNFGCCQFVEVSDVTMEAYYDYYSIPTATCNNPASSDNFMSQSSGCNRYLSPQQQGLIHYQLRTRMKQVLSASGYTAAIQVNNTFDYSVTTSQTLTVDRYFKGDIIVQPDVTLDIRCGVAMTKGSRILVKPRGQLVINGGTVTCISGEVWNGIYLEGTAGQPSGVGSNTVNPGSSPFQGVLRMMNNATVSQASVGVYNHGGSVATAGGIILAQNSNFINNRTDVMILGSGQQSLTPTFNPSWFNNCQFLTTGPIGPTLTPIQHIRIAKATGVQFRGCTFKFTGPAYTYPGYGISSTDASYLVDKLNTTPCVFQNLLRGIDVVNANPLLNPLVQHTSFLDNQYASYIYNSAYLSFLTNTIQVGNCSNCYGLYLNQCNNYKIKDNKIYSVNYTGPGIEVYKSLVGSHEIYKNTFSKLSVGVNCMDKNNNSTNDGLLMNCNIFNIDANYYDIVMSHTTGLANPTVKLVQGVITSAASASNMVRNIYGATCVGTQNKWQIYSAATQTVYHGANTNSTTAVTQPTPNTSCKSPLLNVVDKGISLDYVNHCPLYPPSSGGSSTVQSQRLSSLNDYIGNLQSGNSTGENDFEIQSSIGYKLTLFLGDSTQYNLDSAIIVLSANPGNFVDADLQLVFAYMAKADYDQAGAIITYWNNSGRRPDWVAVLSALINVDKNSVDGILSLQGFATEKALFEDYCENENDAQRVACAILSVASGYEISEPHALPESGSARPLVNGLEDALNNPSYSLYPNPTSTGFYFSKSDSKETVLEIHDLLGKKISTQSIGTKQTNVFVDMTNLPVGLYIVTLKQADQVVYTSKIAKEN
jgi:hypothetical protein